MATRVLIVDDEEGIAELVRDSLADAGIESAHASDGAEALTVVRSYRPDLVILDLALPGLDGLEVCRRLRGDRQTADLPIIMLTAKTGELDRVVGLELGADDYVVKPFSGRELVARVKALLRRTRAQSDDGVRRIGQLELDEGRHEVRVADQPVELTTTEFLLLNALMSARGRVLSREQLFRVTTGQPGSERVQSRTIDVHVSHLRDKLGPEAARLLTVKGVGYRFDDK